MKKFFAAVMALVMMLVMSITAFAAGQISVEQAKQAAVNYVGVKASEVTSTKAHIDWDNGRQVYEIEFFVNGTEYDMDVDVNTGMISDFSVDYHGGAVQPGYNGGYNGGWDDWDDRYDYDWDDRYDNDWDDRYDNDWDDAYDNWFDWDD